MNRRERRVGRGGTMYACWRQSLRSAQFPCRIAHRVPHSRRTRSASPACSTAFRGAQPCRPALLPQHVDHLAVRAHHRPLRPALQRALDDAAHHRIEAAALGVALFMKPSSAAFASRTTRSPERSAFATSMCLASRCRRMARWLYRSRSESRVVRPPAPDREIRRRSHTDSAHFRRTEPRADGALAAHFPLWTRSQ